MAYSIGQYFNQDTRRHQRGVSCNITGLWYFAKRYGKAAFDESECKRGLFTAEGAHYDDID